MRTQSNRVVVTLVAVVVFVAAIVGTDSAFATVRGFFFAEQYVNGTLTRTVDGVRFSLRVPPRAVWENDHYTRVGTNKTRTRSMLITKNTVGPQGAEAVIFWTALPDGGEARPCDNIVRGRGGPRSAADLAAAVAKAPGIKVVKRPAHVTVGGRPAMYVRLSVRNEYVGCDPGFFFSWPSTMRGAFWIQTDAGDTIRMWIVDVRGKHLVIEAETKTRDSDLAREITKIVGSIRFD